MARVLRTLGQVTDDELDSAYGLVRLAALDAGWVATSERVVPRYEGKMKPPVPRS